MRRLFIGLSLASLALVVGIGYFWTSSAYFAFLVLGPIIVLGIFDMTQTKKSIKRNFPVIGNFRYLLEEIRPEIQQYFIETNEDGMPFSREARSLIYQRSKKVRDSVPFGTQRDLYQAGTEWINHSIVPKATLKTEPRILIGGGTCKKPYEASLLNISAMSFGSLSTAAIRALNRGAKMGGFAHNTGEGGISTYHLEPQGDLIWQIGTGYFGCRSSSGGFDLGLFRERAQLEQVKMIEVKLSQGAKPGHGGILPASKLTPEIAAIRGVELGRDVLSPPGHSAFTTPIEFLEWMQTLREGSGGKPVGFKLCVGKRREFFAICKAMVETGLTPDFITVDGAEGGTGAAPLEFTNSIGTPLNDGLIFVHNALTGVNVRGKVRVAASGKISTGFHIAAKLALGADYCNSARGMMFALGCIQALRCNSNTCPTGVATQNAELVAGLNVPDKAQRVKNFHEQTIHSFLEVLAASGLAHPSELKPWHIQRRLDTHTVRHYGECYEYLEPGSLLETQVPVSYRNAWEHATSKSF